MDLYLPYIFILNILLTLVDATIGYHAAPLLVHLGAVDEEGAAEMTRGIRTLLALVVALYSFFSCLAYYRQKPLLLFIVTAVIIADIAAQLVISRKMKNRGK